MIKIAMCDDETIQLMKMKRMIDEYLSRKQILSQIECFESGKELLRKMTEGQCYDVVFLDVNMEEIDGLETARQIRLINNSIPIVFLTAFITYALEGYKVNAVRYLLKEDFNFEQSLHECINVLLDKLKYQDKWLEFDVRGEKVRISSDRILYVESQLHKLIFYVDSNGIKEYQRYEKLDKIYLELADYGFFRIHQSYLVNMKYVMSVERYQAVLDNGAEVSISKRYYKEFERAYLKAKGDI